MKRIFMRFIFSLIFLSILLLNASLAQVTTTLSLTAEEEEVIKPLRTIVDAWYKEDIDLGMSVYHEKAVIELVGGGKVNKERLRKILRPGSPSLSYHVEKIEISGGKASIECTQRFGNKTFPRKFDLVKEGGTWLIIGYWLQ
jgi:hypothetical protein